MHACGILNGENISPNTFGKLRYPFSEFDSTWLLPDEGQNPSLIERM
jgi:hypothetical protein